MSTCDDPGRLARDAYTYLHLPIVAGIIATAVGTDLLIAEPHHALHGVGLAMMLGGPALFLLGESLFRRRDRTSNARAGGRGAFVLLVPSVQVSALLLSLIIAALLTALVLGVRGPSISSGTVPPLTESQVEDWIGPVVAAMCAGRGRPRFEVPLHTQTEDHPFHNGSRELWRRRAPDPLLVGFSPLLGLPFRPATPTSLPRILYRDRNGHADRDLDGPVRRDGQRRVRVPRATVRAHIDFTDGTHPYPIATWSPSFNRTSPPAIQDRRHYDAQGQAVGESDSPVHRHVHRPEPQRATGRQGSEGALHLFLRVTRRFSRVLRRDLRTRRALRR